MNQIRTIIHILSIFVPLCILLLIERLVGLPVVSLMWIDIFRTRLHWPGQLALWLAMGVLMSWIFTWPIGFGCGAILIYWALMNIIRHKPKFMIFAQVLITLIGYWVLKMPITLNSGAFIALQLLASYGLFHYDQNHSLMA